MTTEDGKVIEKEQDRHICRTYGKGVLIKGSNTINLFQHLCEHHLQAYADLALLASKVKCSSASEATTKQPTLPESIVRSVKYLPDSPQAKELNCAVTYYIAKPISVVERSGFKHMLLKLNPRYQVPARRHFTDYEILLTCERQHCCCIHLYIAVTSRFCHDKCRLHC